MWLRLGANPFSRESNAVRRDSVVIPHWVGPARIKIAQRRMRAEFYGRRAIGRCRSAAPRYLNYGALNQIAFYGARKPIWQPIRKAPKISKNRLLRPISMFYNTGPILYLGKPAPFAIGNWRLRDLPCDRARNAPSARTINSLVKRPSNPPPSLLGFQLRSGNFPNFGNPAFPPDYCIMWKSPLFPVWILGPTLVSAPAPPSPPPYAACQNDDRCVRTGHLYIISRELYQQTKLEDEADR